MLSFASNPETFPLPYFPLKLNAVTLLHSLRAKFNHVNVSTIQLWLSAHLKKRLDRVVGKRHQPAGILQWEDEGGSRGTGGCVPVVGHDT